MGIRKVLAAALLLCFCGGTRYCVVKGFQQRRGVSSSHRRAHTSTWCRQTSKSPTELSAILPQPLEAAMLVRGGDVGAVTQSIVSGLQSGPFGILSLWSIASSVLVPLTLYRQGWSFSVGYGYSVMAMAISMYNILQPTPWTSPWYLVTSTMFYGFRLGSFLLVRQLVSKTKGDEMKATDKSARLQRIPFAVGVALFYSMMASPNLCALQASSPLGAVGACGAALAWAGALLEAIADTHKLIVKQQSKDDSGKFVGPTTWTYKLSRHPNYFGELLFWFGLWFGGAVATKNPIGLVASTIGLYGIYGIMTGATKRIDERQTERYGGQKKYDEWKSKVKAPLFPFVNKE